MIRKEMAEALRQLRRYGADQQIGLIVNSIAASVVADVAAAATRRHLLMNV